MANDERSSSQLSATEVLTTRVLDAPRERVFAAWTDPAQLTRWWGPAGFTSTFLVHEPRAQGAWRFILHGPDGRNYENHGVFAELLPPSRIVFEHQSGPVYRASFDFEALGGRTRVRWHMRFENERFLAQHGALVVSANDENLDRLEAVLSGPARA
ncbi:MAG: SRPBCC domain-containing protein [Myxococcota bacterium]